MTTYDLSKFNTGNLMDMIDILGAIATKKPLPNDFELHDVHVELNTKSGIVFLTNSERQVCVLNAEGDFYSIYVSPIDKSEGSFDDLLKAYPTFSDEGKEWFEMVASALDRTDDLPRLTINKDGTATYIFPDKK